MNEFLKLCKENGIDLDGAQALMDMAHGDGKKAIEFIKYMQGGSNKEAAQKIKTIPSPYGKHGIVKGPYSDSALYCGHANECPAQCECNNDCYCRVHGNCGPVSV